ncbi:Crp/Fnr family transcriptional regulator [Flavobacterium sp. NRK F10]|uniref:Crp/Fnr family transcriptional regulator n=1 Tax=Flavobacterium sp. NRK F10 TaxID=2954931 RepID=UPI002091D18E|nr:Crp/Fnr family transcriptional regulator [Flavobacterium sp. NRK F10]MCO6176242.1 Crp/Fnr family transcriptional regulator [Flavobacterium sp. NRK F10]
MLKEYLNSFGLLSDKEIDLFTELGIQKQLNKGDYFIQEGETCKSVAFVISGLLRSFYFSNKEEDITYCITFPNHFMTAYSSFITQQPTNENIEAITTVDLLLFPQEKIQELEQNHPNWTKFLKIIAEQQYIELEKRIFQLQKNDALYRYTELIQKQPEYIQEVPLKYLASYLGITQRHLSRLRKEISF